MNLPSRKKLIAVVANPQFQVRTLTAAICLLAAAPVFTQGRRIDLVYRRVLINDIVVRPASRKSPRAAIMPWCSSSHSLPALVGKPSRGGPQWP